MHKKPQQYRSGRCIHCLVTSDQINNDHIFPKAWYPDDTPASIQRWTVPSCVKCNEKHGSNEQDLLIWLGSCIGRKDARASGIMEKALRSIKPEFGKNPKDKISRQAKREQFLRATEIVETPTTTGVLPNFGPDPSIQYPVLMTVQIPVEGLIVLGKKIVGGLTYHFESRFIENDNEQISIFFEIDKDVARIIELVERFGQTYDIGPGITVARAVSQGESNAVLFKIEIWGRLKIYGELVPREGTAS